MTEFLDSSYRWFWISSVLTVVLAALLFLVTRRRDLWLRCVAAEAAFWTRLKIPARMVEASRKFEASRLFVGFLWFVVAMWSLLVVANLGAYLYFKSQFSPQRDPEIRPIEPPSSVQSPR